MKPLKFNNFSILIMILISLSGIVRADDNQVHGNWLLTKVIENNSVIEPFVSVDFAENGQFSSMGIPAGTWKFEKKSKLLKIASKNFKKLNGDNKVLKLSKDELVINNSSSRMVFGKIDPKKTAAENADSGLAGTWIFQNSTNPDIIRLLIFKKPDGITEIEKEPGVESRDSGTWIFNKREKILYLLGHFENLRGKNRVIELSDKKITLENSGEKYQFKKAEQNSQKIERLRFTEDDFFNINGEYKYEDDRDKLPWQDPYEMIEYLKNLHQLKYRFSTLINGTDVFISKTLTAYVKANDKKESVNIDYIFHGYDKNNLPEDTELPPNMINPYRNTNCLYPEKETIFRVTGRETITTPAGIFECTVIEAANDFNIDRKLWMIDNKPGIYAKIIIDDNSADFPHYSVYELQNIK